MQLLMRWLRRINRGTLGIIILFCLLLPLANPRVYATDEVQYYVYLRSLRFDHDLDFANDYQEFARRNPRSGIEGSLLQSNRIRAKTGLYGNIAPIGSAIMWSPFFLAADAGVQLTNLFGANIPADGFSRPYILSVCYASALYGLLGLLLCRRLALGYCSPTATTAATIAIWLASPLVFYMFIQMPFAHATGFFLTSVFLTLWQRGRADGQDGGESGRAEERRAGRPHGVARTWQAWMLLGFVAGLMTMVREQLGLFVVLLVVEGMHGYWNSMRLREWQAVFGLIGRHCVFGITFVLTLVPQLVVYQVLNGEPRPAGEVSGRINWCSPHLIDTLVDYDPAPSVWCNTVGDFTANFPAFSRGAFVWSPLLLPGLIGLGLLWRRDRLLTIGLLFVFLAQCYINGAYGTTWHLRGAFGFRRLIECTPLFVLGLGLVLDRLAQRIQWRWLLIGLAVCVAWNAGLVVNATFFEAETNLRRIGLIWPNTWRWQFEVIGKVITQLEEIVLRRCRFLQNSSC